MNKNTKIIRTVPVYYPKVTGPTNQAAKISEYLEKEGFKSPVHTSNKGAEGRPTQEIINGVAVTRHKPIGEYMSFTITPSFVSAVSNAEFDILHSHSYRGFMSEVASRLCDRQEKPFVLHAHGTFTGYKRIAKTNDISYKLYDTITRKKCVKKADAVIVSSEQEFEEAVEFGIKREKLSIIPAGKDINRYRTIPRDPPDDHIRLLFVGRISRNRNVETLIQSLANLPDEVRLRIVGGEAKSSELLQGGYVQELRNLGKKLGVQSRVEFVGPKYNDELIREYRTAHIFVYPSAYENFGQTMLEAAAAELPIIATPEGVASDLVRNAKTGYLVNYDDPDMISEKVIKIINEDMRIYSENISRIAKDKYDWEQILPQYIHLYRDLL